MILSFEKKYELIQLPRHQIRNLAQVPDFAGKVTYIKMAVRDTYICMAAAGAIFINK